MTTSRRDNLLMPIFACAAWFGAVVYMLVRLG